MSKTPNNKSRLFQETILIHLDSAYNYARWLTRNASDADDLTQEACTRAFVAFDSFKHTNARSWLLTIVRHTFLNQKQKEQRRGEVIYLDSHSQTELTPTTLQDTQTPEKALIQKNDVDLVNRSIQALSSEFREMIVLRELEGFSYNEIALITDCALGTVMSRLSRARSQLKSNLTIAINDQDNSEEKV